MFYLDEACLLPMLAPPVRAVKSILRLKEEWKHDFEAWQQRPLKKRYLYFFVDGFYVKAGEEREKTAVLTVLGVGEDGQKELLCMEQGYRESASSWAEVLRSLQARGMTEAPLVVIGDGALGIWSALSDVFPQARHQRCWNHRAVNLIDKLPKRLQGQVRKQLRELAEAPDRAECERLRDKLCAHWRAIGQALPRSAWSVTGMTSSPSTTSPRNTGSTSAAAIPSSPSSPVSGCAPTPPSECACVKTRSI
jgi:transposase-like protein